MHPSSRVRWSAVAAVAVTICLLSVVPPLGPSGPELGPLGLVGQDKWFHAVGYAALGSTLVVALVGRGGATGRAEATRGTAAGSVVRVALLALATAVAYGAAMELLQWPLPARTCSLLDLAANAVGATLAISGWVVWRRFGFASG